MPHQNRIYGHQQMYLRINQHSNNWISQFSKGNTSSPLGPFSIAMLLYQGVHSLKLTVTLPHQGTFAPEKTKPDPLPNHRLSGGRCEFLGKAFLAGKSVELNPPWQNHSHNKNNTHTHTSSSELQSEFKIQILRPQDLKTGILKCSWQIWKYLLQCARMIWNIPG